MHIKFLNESVNTKQSLAKSLKDNLEIGDEGFAVEIKRERSNTQDGGTILSLVLGSSLLTAIAQGLFNWLQRNKGIEIELINKDESLKIKCSSRNDLKEIESFISKIN